MFLQRKVVHLFFSIFISLGLHLLTISVAKANGYVAFEIVPISATLSNDTPNVFVLSSTSTRDTVTNITTTQSTENHLRMIDEEDYSFGTVRARIGLTILPDFFPAISLESHLGFDVSDGTQDVAYTDEEHFVTTVTDGNNNDAVLSETDVFVSGVNPNPVRPQTIELDTYVGFYIRGDFKITNDATVYINVGYASAQLAGDFGNYGLPNDDTASSPSYAVGATYALPWWGLTAFFDYTQLIDTDNFKISGFGLGLSAELE